MAPRSMSRPTVLAPPNPGNLATTPTPETARRSVLRSAEGKLTVRSNTLPGDVPERGHLHVGPHRSLASDTGVGTENHSCPDSGPRTYDRARGDPAPRPLKELATRNLAVLSVIATTTCTGSTESMLFSISTSPSTGYPLTLSEIAAWASS